MRKRETYQYIYYPTSKVVSAQSCFTPSFIHCFLTPHSPRPHTGWLWSQSQASFCLGTEVLMSLDGEWREDSHCSFCWCLSNAYAYLLHVTDFGHCRGLLREPQSDHAPRIAHLLPNDFVFREHHTSSKLQEKGCDIRLGWMCCPAVCMYMSPRGLPCMASYPWPLLKSLPAVSQAPWT